MQKRYRPMVYQKILHIDTRGRGTTEISGEIEAVIAAAGIDTGLCQIFIHHTSASLIVSENADPAVRRDLERFMAGLAPDGDPAYEHRMEGPDDMPAHIRSVLTHMALSIPVTGGRSALGTWQGIYLWEHRSQPHRRKLTVTVYGDQ